jgi:hypothetical protein
MNRSARRHLVSLAILIPLGLSTKCYSGPFEQWVRNSAGGILYEMFWIWLIGLIRFHRKPWIAGIAVFAVTSGLEFTQLWHAPFLEIIRGTFPGRTLIGTSFTWTDLPHYAAGCVLGVAGSIWMNGTAAKCGFDGEGKKNPRQAEEMLQIPSGAP